MRRIEVLSRQCAWLPTTSFRFIAGFLLIYGLLYGINHVWMGSTVPGGYYNAWLALHADYISGLRSLILYGSSRLLEWSGYDTYVHGYYMRIIGGKGIRMVYSCIGLNIIFVWWAFNIAFPQPLKHKIMYLLSGTVLIILLNMVRIALVAMSPYKGRFLNTPFDHHAIFNAVVYGLIILAIFRIINQNTRAVTNRR